ncbi:serine/threonine protein kinase [Turneriella parva]|uniref:Stress response kinase A n=1 Tax=Turneriella parva (strain ATCC BAA-1111 / DSM 21527 / NCTC 11395 / H) TaxID=869212 RepID=I4B7K1_TURPD|nr:serine/threonine protein kinase [Turneriella parva]AFM13258.1 aminoglycoside phosphotransferase [Turneriella parva DSM 21527]
MQQKRETDYFYQLTPDEIIDAVIKLGLEPSGHISQLNSMENRVFDLRLESGKHIVTKFYRPGRWSREQILEEHAFLFELAEDEIPALAPLKFDGQSLFEEQGIYFAIWPRTGGREPEELSEIDLQILGRLLARVHNVGASAKSESCRPAFNSDRFVREPLEVLREKHFLKDNHALEYAELAERIAHHYDVHHEELPLLRIHGDLHKGNILNGSEGWFLLDFDDSLVGPAVQDVWMLFPGDENLNAHARSVFLAAYREFRHFEERWLALAETLRAMRIIHYSGWIARRYDDPSFTSAFPDFASDSYWQEEIGILRDICASMGDSYPIADTGEALSNKDFFFDYED